MNGAALAFALAYRHAKAGHVVRLGRVAGVWRVTVAPIVSTAGLTSN